MLGGETISEKKKSKKSKKKRKSENTESEVACKKAKVGKKNKDLPHKVENDVNESVMFENACCDKSITEEEDTVNIEDRCSKRKKKKTKKTSKVKSDEECMDLGTVNEAKETASRCEKTRYCEGQEKEEIEKETQWK